MYATIAMQCNVLLLRLWVRNYSKAVNFSLSLHKPDFEWPTGSVDKLIDDRDVLVVVVLQLVVLQ